MERRAGRPQGRPRGSTAEANALAEFLLGVTGGMTVRELAEAYHVSKTLWGEYRSGQKIIPLELLRRLVHDRTPDERTRRTRLETAGHLHTAALGATPQPPPQPPPEPPPAAGPVLPVASGGQPPRRPARRSLLFGGVAGVAGVVVLAVLAALVAWRLPGAPGDPAGGVVTAPPRSGSGVFSVGPGGRGVFRWDGGDRWTKIGDAARRLWSGPAGLFATGMDGRLYVYGGRPGVWSPIGDPGADVAVSGSHVYRLAADRQSVHVWDGQGASWTWIGGPATRLHGGARGLFAIAPGTGWIWSYQGVPARWDFAGLEGASFAVAGENLYGLTPDRGAVNRWPGEPGRPWPHAAGPAGELYGGAAGLFSTDPQGARLRVLPEAGPGGEVPAWQDIGPAGAETRVGGQAVYVLSADRTEILRRLRDTGAWQRIGGPAETLTVWEDPGPA
ncbi:helix-turn-helix domain-containing protein [Nonomuraea sp. NPDC048826]|uniref:helix-turn-helix domain-containing protein n=1 Tax=Nonomuraea sp. NPDC048826 TaxID=3364347 RepID=UPI003720B9D0